MSRQSHVNKSEVLEGALLLFWKQGYKATNLPDLLEATGLTRGTFYRTFADKREAYIEALQYYGNTRYRSGLDLLARRDGDHVADRLKRLFERSEASAPGKPDPQIGCFLCNAMVEVAPFDKDIARECNRLCDHMIEELKTVLEDLSTLNDADEINRIAKFLARLYFGSHATGRMGQGFDEWDDFFQSFCKTE